MKFSLKPVIFIIGVCSLISLASALCTCYDCTKCNINCSAVCGNGACFANGANELLCQSYINACNALYGCYRTPATVVVFPAVNYDESNTAWKNLTISLRPDCCFPLPPPLYDNTLSSIKTTVCVNLYDSNDCTGTAYPVSASTTNINSLYPGFNDKASSISLC